MISSEDTRNPNQKQFDIGQRSLLDLLDTENEVFSAKNQLAEARIDSEIAKLRILTGTGELLEAMEIMVPEIEEPMIMEEEEMAVADSAQ